MSHQKGTVYLIPVELYEGVNETIAPYVLDAIKKCSVFFVENERTARRCFKRLWRDMVIDDYQWIPIHKAESEVLAQFSKFLEAGKTVGILSEAGCPGVADPGQILVARAQQLQVSVKPLTGPNSILLALMASGLNGQSFRFSGYLPIDGASRKNAIRTMETEAFESGTTQLFIETPFRNRAMLNDLKDVCRDGTLLCIACDLTAPTEWIRTLTIAEWKKQEPDLHKKPVIFLLGVPHPAH
jgi:16S rRNA (cytidine1402-2'-O)-methyltransferase